MKKQNNGQTQVSLPPPCMVTAREFHQVATDSQLLLPGCSVYCMNKKLITISTFTIPRLLGLARNSYNYTAHSVRPLVTVTVGPGFIPINHAG